MDDFGQQGHYSRAAPRRVYFNKPALCKGEAFKVVVTTEPRYNSRQFVLRLFSLTENGIERLLTESALMGSSGEDGERISFFQDVETADINFAAGDYTARVYAPIPELRDQGLEPFLIGEHSFRVIEYDNYIFRLQEMCGDDWDEPVYLDTTEIDQLNHLFIGWMLEPLSDEELSRRERIRAFKGEDMSPGFLSTMSRTEQHMWLTSSMRLDSYAGDVMERIEQMLRRAMGETRNSQLPFLVGANSLEVSGLPHVDLTKLFWIINALGSTLADLMFFCKGVIFSITTKHDTISLDLRPSDDIAPVLPSKEPPIFQVVREAVLGSLNFDLIYDESNGVNLSIKANQSPFTASAGQH
jgi:hypothetical protein